jgi:hypothetical protein
LSSQRLKLVGNSHGIPARHVELTLGNHVHEFDSGRDGLCRSEGFKPVHRFDGTMTLLDENVGISGLPNHRTGWRIRIWLAGHALLAPLLSVVTVSGRLLCTSPCRNIALALCSRIAFGAQRDVDGFALPVTARWKYSQTPSTIMYASSTHQPSPTACL